MAILNESDLQVFKSQYASSTVKAYAGRKDRLNEASSRSAVTVFLSHSHDDQEQIEAAITLLSTMGVEVYVDWLDAEMPRVTNGETAARLKQKIKDNGKFVLLASPKAIASNWVNWELGIGDTHKYIEHIALLPFVRGNESWKDSEYLQIYPYIEKEYSFSSGKNKDDYVVKHPSGKSIKLEQWLKL